MEPLKRITSQAASETSTLTPTTERFIRECPRARILIVGRSGVGKSSLANAIFKTSFPIKHHQAGSANINEEHISEYNERFVLHDSQGYEPADERKFRILENFIKKRTHPSRPVKERLHAIWLCIPAPFADGRFEHGDEKIFSLQRGKVPIIVVFTQFDLLTASVQYANGCGKAIGGEIQKQVAEIFEKKGVAPFKELTKEIGEIPFVAVSIRQPDTLEKLVQITTQYITPTDEEVGSFRHSPVFKLFRRRSTGPAAAMGSAPPVRRQATLPDPYGVEEDPNDQRAGSIEDLSDAPQVALAMAQRVCVSNKIAATVNVGKKKYWLAIASGVHFLNIRLEGCLKVMHTDIINVWNIRGMKEYFLADAFRGRMTTIVQDLSDRREESRPVQTAMSIASAVAGITVAVAPAVIATPVGAIAAPLAAAFFLATWAYGMYQKTPDIICCLMAYVVDLTIIMRAVFQDSCEDDDGIIQRDRVEKIIAKYEKSTTKKEIHDSIRGFVQSKFPFGRSTVVEKMEALIQEDRNITP